MAGYIGSKAVLLSTTAATVTGDATIGGDLTVDTNTLFVDSTNNRVGVGTSFPRSGVDIANNELVGVGNIAGHSNSGAYTISAGADLTNGGFIQLWGGLSANPDVLILGSSSIESMRIDEYRNVGIGTPTPDGKLHVRDDSGTVGKAVFQTTDQRLTLGTYWEGGVGQYAFINSSSSVESVGQAIKFQTGGTDRIVIEGAGNVNIGEPAISSSRLRSSKANPSGYDNAHIELVSTAGDVILSLHAAGTSAVCMDHVRGGAGFRFVNLVRTAHVPIEASAFNVNSDYRVKENITDLTGASERLKQLPVHRFSFIEGSMMYRDGAIVDGFLAHEVQAVVPEAVTGEKDAMRMESYEITPEERDAEGNIVTEAVYGEREVPDLQSIDQSKLVPLLTAALQEALNKITDLEARVTALETV